MKIEADLLKISLHIDADQMMTRTCFICTEPEVFAEVSEAGAIFTPGSVEICLSIHSPLEHLKHTHQIVFQMWDQVTVL